MIFVIKEYQNKKNDCLYSNQCNLPVFEQVYSFLYEFKRRETIHHRYKKAKWFKKLVELSTKF